MPLEIQHALVMLLEHSKQFNIKLIINKYVYSDIIIYITFGLLYKIHVESILSAEGIIRSPAATPL